MTTPEVRFGPDGLAPAVIQDVADGRVLMVGYMDAEALAATTATGDVHFHSRSRGPPLAQGRDQRPRPAARRLGGRLRRRRAAGHGRSRRADLPSRHPQLLRPRRRAGRARLAGFRLARDAVGDDRGAGRRASGRLVHDLAPRWRRRRGRPQGDRRGDRGPPRRQGRRRDRDRRHGPDGRPDAPLPASRPTCCTTCSSCSPSATRRRRLSSRPCGSGIAPEPGSATDARAGPASPGRARSRAVACRCGRPATPRRSAPERSAASVMRTPLIVTPPPAISRRASPFDARSPASASSVALPAASHAGSNVNPPADAYRAARTAGSSIGVRRELGRRNWRPPERPPRPRGSGS